MRDPLEAGQEVGAVMRLGAGDVVPDVQAWTMGTDGPVMVYTGEVLSRGRVVLFAVPGAFMPGCSQVHLPGYVERAHELARRGVDRVVCLAINDAWVMDGWSRSQGVGEAITMVADADGTFTQAMGMVEVTKTGGLGLRSRRYAAIVQDGVIERLDVESKHGVTVSACAAVLEHL
ncbi:peroxiredoxin [soil metagenome]